jgi:hypothetical protein
VFNEEIVFSGEEVDLIDNLMHSTLKEIKTWVKIIELLDT